MSTEKQIVIRGVTLYLHTDKEGYITIESDGYLPNAIKPFLDMIYDHQTDDDREWEQESYHG